ncbi:hypothetical protein D3C72_2515850 [compost metagenome]
MLMQTEFIGCAAGRQHDVMGKGLQARLPESLAAIVQLDGVELFDERGCFHGNPFYRRAPV